MTSISDLNDDFDEITLRNIPYYLFIIFFVKFLVFKLGH